MHILLAEDDPHISFLMKLTLEKMGGHTVEVASDGEEALNKFYQQTFDLVILDGMMPKKDGLEVCRDIKASPKSKTPIIFLSAKSQARDIQAGLDAGALGYIEKPFDPKTILLKIEEILNS